MVFFHFTGGSIFGIIFFILCVMGIGVVVWISKKDAAQSHTVPDNKEGEVDQIAIDMPDQKEGGSQKHETRQTGTEGELSENTNAAKALPLTHAEILVTAEITKQDELRTEAANEGHQYTDTAEEESKRLLELEMGGGTEENTNGQKHVAATQRLINIEVSNPTEILQHTEKP